MAKRKVFLIDRKLAEALSGREKLRALVVAKAGGVQPWAREHGFYPEQITMTLSGARPYPEVRAALAEDLGIPRDEVDALIEGDREEDEGKANGTEAGPGKAAKVA